MIVWVGVLGALVAGSLELAGRWDAQVAAEVQAEAAPDESGNITREWRWLDGTVTTTFTAYGPPEQVNAFDPHGSPLQCPDCELASSVQYGPEDETLLTGTGD